MSIKSQASREDPSNLYHALAVEMGIDDPFEIQQKVMDKKIELLKKLPLAMNYASARKELSALDDKINESDKVQADALKEARVPFNLFIAVTTGYDKEKRARLQLLRDQLLVVLNAEPSSSQKVLDIERTIDELEHGNLTVGDSLEAEGKNWGELAALPLAYNVMVKIYQIEKECPEMRNACGTGFHKVYLLWDNGSYIPCAPKTATVFEIIISWIKALFSSKAKKINTITAYILEQEKKQRKTG